MRLAIFNTADHDRAAFEAANMVGGRSRHALLFIEARLRPETAALADRCEAAAITVHDRADAASLRALHDRGIRLLALRSKGTDHVDTNAALKLGLRVVAASDYSPYAVAEHAVGLLLALTRHLMLADRRVRAQDFRLHGLLGCELHGRRVGVVGVGRIGRALAGILLGFGCEVIGCDPDADPCRLPRGLALVPLRELLRTCHAISLHCPLTPATRHLIDGDALALLPARSLLVNTSRGGVVDTHAVIEALLSGHLGGFATDVLEDESSLFGNDLTLEPLPHGLAARLIGMPNVIVTPHQAWLTAEALRDIANAVLDQCSAFEQDRPGRERLVLQA